jgi:hypothetical protein
MSIQPVVAEGNEAGEEVSLCLSERGSLLARCPSPSNNNGVMVDKKHAPDKYRHHNRKSTYLLLSESAES